jgi:hypothetical protein
MISNLITVHPTGVELFQVDGRTDERRTKMTKQVMVFLKAARRATPPVYPLGLAQTICTTAPCIYLISADTI